MERLTYKEDNGKWGIVGMNDTNESEKIYAVASKLLDYEETGISPDGIWKLKVSEEFWHREAIRLAAEMGEMKFRIAKLIDSNFPEESGE